MSTTITPSALSLSPRAGDGSLPPLESGDRLTLEEFLRRYEAMPNVNKAELIEGIVHMPSPVRIEHASPHNDFNGIFWVYKLSTPGVEAGDNGTIKLDDVNGPQPDVYLRILPECGGQSRTDDGYVVAAPELVGEVAASSVTHDLRDKFVAYQRNGVQEYLVWRVWDRALDCFALRDGGFERREPDADGIHRSAVFPGLWIDVPALLAGDRTRVLAVLQAGLATPAHAEFVASLQARCNAPRP